MLKTGSSHVILDGACYLKQWSEDLVQNSERSCLSDEIRVSYFITSSSHRR